MSQPAQRALIVGIKDYRNLRQLDWTINDALAMYEVLRCHENGEPNFACHLVLGCAPVDAPVGAARLAGADVSFDATYNSLFNAFEQLLAFDGTVLLYFSGHGVTSPQGRCLAAQDSTKAARGIQMNELLKMANHSKARNVLMIIDSCYSGWIGDPPEGSEQNWNIPEDRLKEGVTILAAARPDEKAIEIEGHGVFTRLVLGALKGGAADVRGRVSAASIYAYVEQALGPWQQRPVHKSNASSMPPIRFCRPLISDDLLRRLPTLFLTPEFQVAMDTSFEVTSPNADPEKVKIFKTFKRYQIAGLLRPAYAFDEDLYFVAINRRKVELTPLGQFYWQLAKDGRLSGSPAFESARSNAVIDPESLAKLFHETYERLAPFYQYETREATRTTWDKVPDRNKRLMIAVATEVLATLANLEKDAATQATAEAHRPPSER